MEGGNKTYFVPPFVFVTFATELISPQITPINMELIER